MRDRVSVRETRGLILESLLDLDLIRETSAEGGAAGAPCAERCGRAGLYRAGAGDRTPGGPRNGYDRRSYPVDPEIERLTAAPAAKAEEHADRILNALRKEMAYLPTTALVPIILTSMESRATLQRLVASEDPRMSVMAHEELPPGQNVQPVARIARRSRVPGAPTLDESLNNRRACDVLTLWLRPSGRSLTPTGPFRLKPDYTMG